MKSIFFLMASILAFQVSAYSIQDMQTAAGEATTMNQTQFGEQSVLAYKVDRRGHDMEVEVFSRFLGEDFVVEYECHYEGSVIDCHEHADHDHELAKSLQLGQSSLSLLREGEAAALRLINTRLHPSLVSYKVWSLTDVDGDTDVWARLNFEVSGVAQSFFAVCHDIAHGDEPSHFHCHVARSTPLEPQF
jgi:hypothetical protein